MSLEHVRAPGDGGTPCGHKVAVDKDVVKRVEDGQGQQKQGQPGEPVRHLKPSTPHRDDKGG